MKNKIIKLFNYIGLVEKYAFFLAKVIFSHFYANVAKNQSTEEELVKTAFLLEMWLGLLTFYFSSPKGFQKIFFGGSLDMWTLSQTGFALQGVLCRVHTNKLQPLIFSRTFQGPH